MLFLVSFIVAFGFDASANIISKVSIGISTEEESVMTGHPLKRMSSCKKFSKSFYFRIAEMLYCGRMLHGTWTGMRNGCQMVITLNWRHLVMGI